MAGHESQHFELIDQLAEEFAARYRRGEHPSLEEYVARHPEFADEIRELLTALAEVEQVKVDFCAPVESAPDEGAVSPLLQQFGDFRILREVGKGGMGIVYEAEQVSLGRRVALKVLPKKMLLDANAKQRFEREAKAAAKLHHTNIVPVFGVGEQDGLPYYVMQFIHGLGLDDVLDELRQMQGKDGSTTRAALRVSRKDVSAADVAKSLLSGQFRATTPPDVQPAPDATVTVTEEPAHASESASGVKPCSTRLSDSFTLTSSSAMLPGTNDSRGSKSQKSTYWQSVASLGVQVSDALEYAHKQGILHRDIKPSNLLLDTGGTAWVADFGLAKTDDQQNITHTGDILGTLRYMPPEAFEGHADARSDVYSLGLTLYELLALQPAFDGSDRNNMVKQVMTTDPPRLDRLNPAIPRDLVTIVHKALDREPGHRYPSAAELAADLQRFVDDEPIQARRLTQRERLWRTCRRHPGVAGLTAALVALLLAVTVVSVFAAAHFDQLASQEAISAKNERDARFEAQSAKQQESILRDRAEKNQQLAQANFVKARAAVDDYLTKVSENQLLDVPGLQPLRHELLQSALAFYQDFVKQDGADPALRAELAATYLRVAQIQKELSEDVKRREAYEQGLKLYQALLKEAPSSADWQHGVAQCQVGLGNFGQAIAIWQGLVQPGQTRFQKDLADAYNLSGGRHTRTGKAEESLEDHQKALAIREMLARTRPTDPDAHRDLGQSLNNIATHLWRRKRVTEALALYRRAVEHAEVAVALSPQTIIYRRALANFNRNAALSERELDHPKEALPLYERVVEIRGKVARDNPAMPVLQTELLSAYCELAVCLRLLDQPDKVNANLRLARELIDRLPGEGAKALFGLACARAKLSTAEEPAERKRQADLAVELLHKAVTAGFRDLPRYRQAPELATLRTRADAQALEQEMTGALAVEPAAKLAANQRALTLWQKLANDSPQNLGLQADLAASQHAIGLVEYDLGKLNLAAKSFLQAHSIRAKLVAQAPTNVSYRMELAATALALGDVHWKAGRLAEWSAAWRTARGQLEAAADANPENPELAAKLSNVLTDIVTSYTRTGMWDEAARHCEMRTRRDAARLARTALDATAARIESRGRFEAACLQLAAGDRDAYRRVCADFQAQMGNSLDGAVAADLVMSWSLVPRPETEAKAIVPWLERAKASPASGERPVQVTAWSQPFVALASLRAGQPQSAIDIAGRSLKDDRWPGRILNYPLLAMAHHRLGHQGEARNWLDKADSEWRRLSPLTHSVTSSRVLPSIESRHWNTHWTQWIAFQLLLNEASVLVAGTAPTADSLDQLHRGFMWSKLGEPKKAGALLESAVKKRPADVSIWLARSALNTALDHSKSADDDLTAAMKLRSTEPGIWIEYGLCVADHHQHARAKTAFTKAAELTAGDLNRFVESGWWVVGTRGEEPRLPPDNQPDPYRSIAGMKSGAQNDWRRAGADLDGRVDLRAIFNSDYITVHAVTHVYAPEDRTAALLVGGDDDMKVWLNGRVVYQQTRFIDWRPGELDRVPVTLKAGRNTLLCRVNQTHGPHYFYLRFADSSYDRGADDPERKAVADRTRQWLETRDKATANYDLAIDLQPDVPGPLLARGRRYEDLGRHKEADADFAAAAMMKPSDAAFWKQHGQEAAASKQWRWALACYTQAEIGTVDNVQFMRYEKSALCVLVNDSEGYRRTCALALAARGKTPGFGYLAIRAGTLAPDCVADMAQFKNAADDELKGRKAYYLVTIAAGANYRAGRFKEAAELLRKSLDENPTWDGKVLIWLWLSLACQRLGQTQEAQQWLAKATNWLDRYPALPHQPDGATGLHLHDWLEAHILRREAEARLQPGVR